MQRLTAANHVRSIHWSPQADPLRDERVQPFSRLRRRRKRFVGFRGSPGDRYGR